jgi:hypothetical protein
VEHNGVCLGSATTRVDTSNEKLLDLMMMLSQEMFHCMVVRATICHYKGKYSKDLHLGVIKVLSIHYSAVFHLSGGTSGAKSAIE